MSTYKNFINAARLYCNSSGFLRFLLAGRTAIFAAGGFLYMLGAFLLNLDQFSTGFAIYDAFAPIGLALAVIGLIFCILADDAISLVVVSSVISAGALAAFITLWARGVFATAFMFGPLFWFIVFLTIMLLTVIKADKFKEMRAASAARASMAAIVCPKCGSYMSIVASFCPSCGAPSPVVKYAPPPQYAPPVQSQPQYAAPVQPQYAPPAQPQYATPAEIHETTVPKCSNCGADITPGTVFCAKCGTKQ